MNVHNTLYISDLDGTLLNKSAQLSPYTVSSLNNMISKGLNFSIATARLFSPVKKMLEDVDINIPIILMNGVLIYDTNTKSYIKVNEFKSNSIDTIIDLIKRFKITSFMYELDNQELQIYHKIFDENLSSNYAKERAARYNSTKGFPAKPKENVIYFTLMDTYERLKPVYDIISKQDDINQTLYENVYCKSMWYLEIFSNKASKKNAVEFIRDLYNFNYIIGFGDNHNDLSLFEACDICVAVENATTEIKEKANFICQSNNNDGVIKWLENNCDFNK